MYDIKFERRNAFKLSSFFFSFFFFSLFFPFFMHGTNDMCRIPSHYGTTFYNLTLNQWIHLLMTLDECSLCFICFFVWSQGLILSQLINLFLPGKTKDAENHVGKEDTKAADKAKEEKAKDGGSSKSQTSSSQRCSKIKQFWEVNDKLKMVSVKFLIFFVLTSCCWNSCVTPYVFYTSCRMSRPHPQAF